jgi:sulfur transfer complex TusBCD TusB component (DsrH family)
MGAFEDGSSFLAGVLAKLPESLRGQVKDALDKPEAKDAVTLVGDSVLARSDYSKHMDALKAQQTDLTAKFEDLNTWYAANEAALKEYPTLKAELDAARRGGPNPPKPPVDPPIDPRAVAREEIDAAGREYVGVSAWLAGKAVAHAQMFSEPLDTMALVSNPKLGKPIVGQPGRVFSLDDAYREAHGERVTTKQKEAHDKSINDEVEKRVTEKLKGSINQPFPLRGEAPSVLDELAAKERPVHSLDSAVAEYERLQTTR